MSTQAQIQTTEVKELIRVSRAIGQHKPFWVQGAGGNVSVKTAEGLWIKASGQGLEKVGEPNTLACIGDSDARTALFEILSRKKLQGAELDKAEKQYSDLIKQASEKSSSPEFSLGVASMETGFHLALPQKWVLHFHSISSHLMLWKQQQQGAKWTSWISKTEFKEKSIKLCPALRPGLVLSQSLMQEPQYEIYLLESHGVILQADDPSILEKWKKFEERFLQDWGYGEVLLFRDKSPESLLGQMDRYPKPLRFFFPDTAVFKQYVLDVLDRFYAELKAEWPSLNNKTQGAVEILLATHLLQEAEPYLPELPLDIQNTVAGLPTELRRLPTQQSE